MFDKFVDTRTPEVTTISRANGRWEQTRIPAGEILSEDQRHIRTTSEMWSYAVVVEREGDNFAIELEIDTGCYRSSGDIFGTHKPNDRARAEVRLHLPYEIDEDAALRAAREAAVGGSDECKLLKQRCWPRLLSSTSTDKIAEFLFSDVGVQTEIPFGLKSARRANNLIADSLRTQRTEAFWERLELELYRRIKDPVWAPAPKYKQCECCAGKGAVKL